MTTPLPTGAELMVWLGCAAFLLALFNGGAKAWDRLHGSSSKTEIAQQPIEVRGATELARERDCVQRHDSVVAQIVELRSQRITDAKDWSASRGKIYEQIAGVRAELPEMERRLNKADEERSSDLHCRINEILEAVGELRGKTGQ